jgi:hypothetical protein
MTDRLTLALALEQWMIGFNLVLTVGVLWRMLAHA